MALMFSIVIFSTQTPCVAGEYSAERLKELQKNTVQLPASKKPDKPAPESIFKLSGSFKSAAASQDDRFEASAHVVRTPSAGLLKNLLPGFCCGGGIIFTCPNDSQFCMQCRSKAMKMRKRRCCHRHPGRNQHRTEQGAMVCSQAPHPSQFLRMLMTLSSQTRTP